MVPTATEQPKNDPEELLLALAEIPSWTGGEGNRAEFCRNYLTGLGYADVRTDPAGNVILPVNTQPGRRNLAVMAHLDTVFSPEDRFTVRREGEKLFCPGIGDNTANAAALLWLAAELREQPLSGETGLYLVWSTGEEGLGNLRGCRSFMEAYGDRISCFAALDLYYDTVFSSCVGSVRYRIDFRTQGGHSYLDFGRPSALMELAELLHEVRTADVFQSEGLTWNAGRAEGGTSVNRIASRAELLFEFRSEDPEKLHRADEAFRTCIRRRNRADCRVTVEVLGLRPCGSPADPVAQARLMDCLRKAVRDSGCPAPGETCGSTDCNIPLSLEIPSVCFGVCLGGGAHTPQEWIRQDSLAIGREILRRFVRNVTGSEDPSA